MSPPRLQTAAGFVGRALGFGDRSRAVGGPGELRVPPGAEAPLASLPAPDCAQSPPAGSVAPTPF
jgi:hypothetical protein